jgi:hypothetical protein
MESLPETLSNAFVSLTRPPSRRPNLIVIFLVCSDRQSRRLLLSVYTDHCGSSNVVSKSFYRNDDLIRVDTPQQNQEAFHISRPASTRTFGSASGWQSDLESPEPSHGQSTPEAHASSLSHAKNHPAKMQHLLIRDSAKVEEFLERALRTMQQLAVKRIAKAWIKGICPKKQAMFPYHKKKRERQGPNCEPTNQPGWWPEQPLCKFVEPDHIRRDGESPRSNLYFNTTD